MLDKVSAIILIIIGLILIIFAKPMNRHLTKIQLKKKPLYISKKLKSFVENQPKELKDGIVRELERYSVIFHKIIGAIFVIVGLLKLLGVIP